MSNSRALFLLAILTAGCSSSSGGGSNPQTFTYTIPNFTIPATTEVYQCFTITAPTGGTASEDVGAKRFAYVAGSEAVHHIVIFREMGSEPDGTRECAAFDMSWNPYYAGGPVTDPLETPAGVAFPVNEVETWVIQMHYVNASDVPVVDDTQVEIGFTVPGEAFTRAGLVIAGSTNISLQPNTPNQTVVGTCPIPGSPTINVNAFAMWPHMHQLGTNFKVEHVKSTVTTTLIDSAWSFGDQPLWIPPAEIAITNNDQFVTTCTYNNITDQVVSFGESTFEEMCFNFLYYYPAIVNQMLPCGL